MSELETLMPDAVVLVGGQGTRLRSVVSDRPKPLAEVAGRPFLEWLLRLLAAQGVSRAVLATGYLGHLVRAHFEAQPIPGLKLEFVEEPIPLGTGGAVRNALEQVRTERLLVLNGDSYCRVDLRQLIETHLQCRAAGTMWLAQVEDRSRFGSVAVAPDGRVTAFHEKQRKTGRGLVNAGAYVFERALIEPLPPLEAISLERDLLPTLAAEGRLYGTSGHEPMLDIGTPESYRAAEAFLSSYPPTGSCQVPAGC